MKFFCISIDSVVSMQCTQASTPLPQRSTTLCYWFCFTVYISKTISKFMFKSMSHLNQSIVLQACSLVNWFYLGNKQTCCCSTCAGIWKQFDSLWEHTRFIFVWSTAGYITEFQHWLTLILTCGHTLVDDSRLWRENWSLQLHIRLALFVFAYTVFFSLSLYVIFFPFYFLYFLLKLPHLNINRISKFTFF